MAHPRLNTHDGARLRLAAPVTLGHEPLAQAAHAEAIYRDTLEAHLRGRASMHDLLLARIGLMDAWSAWVDARVARGEVAGSLPVCRIAAA